MSGFELAVLLAGGAAMAVFAWAVQKLCDTLTAADERQRAKLEKIHVELIHIADQLSAIKESFQKLDK